jgi:hypothetical protein
LSSPGWLGMVSHVSHSVHVPPKEHIYTKVGQIVEDSPDSWGWSTCLTFGVYHKEHIYTKGGPG